MNLALTFPGQGSQSVGMLAALGAAFPAVGKTFAEASEVLGYDLWSLAQDGPEARLNATEQTQPAMLAAGVAVWRAWVDAGGPPPSIVAGHSLGEFSALVCAGSLDFPTAVSLVAERARLMQSAVPQGEGGIAALLGLEDAEVGRVCAEVVAREPSRQVVPVNYNAPGQVVIAGHADAVDNAIEAAREAGARRAVRLPMSVPVHCPLMAPAKEAFTAALARAEVAPPRVPVVHNADVDTHDDPDTIRARLAEQLVVPVRWGATVQRLAAAGETALVELGPGRVLTGLARRIDRSINGACVHDPASLEQGLALATGEAS